MRPVGEIPVPALGALGPAQVGRTGWSDVLMWVLVLGGAVLVLGAVVLLVRRWALGRPGRGSQPWSLADLRRLHAEGKLSDEEYEHLRAQVIAELGARGSVPRQS